MSVWRKEWAQQVRYRKGTMVTLDELDQIVKYVRDPGYSSVYMFNADDAADIKASGHSRGFDKYTPAADALPIDLDDGDKSLDKALERVDGYSYSLYSSGGKGYHIILDHDLIVDRNLPYSHSQVVASLGIPCDKTLYQPGRILSLPGRVHPKTGRKKELIKRVEGLKIEIPILQKPVVEFNFSAVEGGSVKVALARLWALAEEGLVEGERNNKIWQVASSLIEAGFEFETVHGIMSTLNDKSSNPLETEELTRTVVSAGRRSQ